MAKTQTHILDRPLRTPHAAAIAGIIFAVFQSTSYILLQMSVPVENFLQEDWLIEYNHIVTFALSLLPFSGIAFLWFIGVLRDRLGHLEDQFFSTLFFGSGLLYLAMTFTTAAIAGGFFAAYAADPSLFINSGVPEFVQGIVYKFNNVYAIRMAGMFMFVLGTIWVRTQIMPRWLAFLTYAVALFLLIGITFYPWTMLFFPAWVFLISAYILVLNFRYNQEQDGVTFQE